MALILVAIDPGVSGGICTMDAEGKVETHKMPSTDFDVCRLLADISTKAKEVHLYLEEPPLYAGKAVPGSSIGKLMWNTGVAYGAAIAMGWSVHRVRPAIWMKAHPVGTKGDRSTTQWKNVLKARASELFGASGIKVTLWNADALLLLDAARRGAVN